MSQPEPLEARRLDIDLMRRIDAVCHRFDTDWRADTQGWESRCKALFQIH